ncbi:MAG: ADP-heptose--LPS heptosyltransferase RfaF, partial [Aequorivita vladivostokensis]|nr:ADP-heptose--LPS heptosyltransferase RfaF [Aequorivita vladivostokensis]
MPKPTHILVIRLSAMGDVAMTVPVLRVLAQTYSELKITVLSRPFFKPFFE